MKNNLVSVCIPTFNGEKYLKECLESVLAQTYKDIEILIVDDCSADSTIEILNDYINKDNRIVLYKNSSNIGLVNNWNKCIELSKGEWIKFVFQDDYIAPDCIEKMLNSAVVNDVLVSCNRSFLLNTEADEETKNYYKNEVVTFEKLHIPSEITFVSPEQISNMAAENICMNFIGEPTSVMFKKSIINEVGTFNKNLSQICDLEYFLRIGSNYGVKYIPESLTQFRIHNTSTTSSNINSNLFILSNIEPIGLVHQLLYAEQFLKFRNNLTMKNKTKLEKYFSVRVYEAYKTAETFGVASAEMEKLNAIVTIYPAIKLFKKPSLATLILFYLIILRRRIRLLLNFNSN